MRSAATLAGALALAAATPSEARGGRNAAAAIGFGAGALVGAAVAGSAYNNGYYGPGYGYGPGYAYDPGYTPSRVTPMSRRRSMWRRAVLTVAAAAAAGSRTDTQLAVTAITAPATSPGR